MLTAKRPILPIVLLVAVLANGCGGGDDATAVEDLPHSDDPASEQVDGSGSSTGSPADSPTTEGLALPAWWPAGLETPDQLLIERVADDAATDRYEVIGLVPETDTASVLTAQIRALEAAGFEITYDDQRSISAEKQGTGVFELRVDQLGSGDGTAVGYTVGWLPWDEDTAPSVDAATVGESAGTAVGTFGDQSWEIAGTCTISETEVLFLGSQDGVDIQVQIGTAEGAEFNSLAIFVADDLVSAAIDSAAPEALAAIDGKSFSVEGTLMNLSNRNAASQPGSVRAECE